MIDSYDICWFTLDIPFGNLDGRNVIYRDTHLFCSRDKPDPRPDNNYITLVPLGILDHYPPTDCRRHKICHKTIGIAGPEYKFFQYLQNFLNGENFINGFYICFYRNYKDIFLFCQISYVLEHYFFGYRGGNYDSVVPDSQLDYDPFIVMLDFYRDFFHISSLGDRVWVILSF